MNIDKLSIYRYLQMICRCCLMKISRIASSVNKNKAIIKPTLIKITYVKRTEICISLIYIILQ